MTYNYKSLYNNWNDGYQIFVQKNPDKDWYWKGISINKMALGKKWIHNQRLKIIKGLQIQKY